MGQLAALSPALSPAVRADVTRMIEECNYSLIPTLLVVLAHAFPQGGAVGAIEAGGHTHYCLQ